MRDRVLVAFAFVMAVGPAFAGNPTQVPEPASIAVFGAALTGAYIVRRMMGKK